MIEMRKPKKNNLLTECFQKTSLNSKTRAPQAIEHKPKIDEVHLNPADMNDYYDIAGDNHCFVSTITHYDKPLTMRLSAIKDNQNLEPALEKRGFKTNSISGREHYVILNKICRQCCRKLTPTMLLRFCYLFLVMVKMMNFYFQITLGLLIALVFTSTVNFLGKRFFNFFGQFLFVTN